MLSKQAGLLTMGSSPSVAFPVYFDRPVACWTLTPLLQWRDRVGFAPSFPIILVASWLSPKEPVSTYEIVYSHYYLQILPYPKYRSFKMLV